jgi:hypothetical protein
LDGCCCFVFLFHVYDDDDGVARYWFRLFLGLQEIALRRVDISIYVYRTTFYTVFILIFLTLELSWTLPGVDRV